MAEKVSVQHLHKDILKLQQDINVIKHILSEEGKLTDWAKQQLEKARAEPDSSYTELDDV